PSTPSLPCDAKRLPWVATGRGTAFLSGFRARPFATGCQRLRPLGSINAPPIRRESLMAKGLPTPQHDVSSRGSTHVCLELTRVPNFSWLWRLVRRASQLWRLARASGSSCEFGGERVPKQARQPPR